MQENINVCCIYIAGKISVEWVFYLITDNLIAELICFLCMYELHELGCYWHLVKISSQQHL